MASHASHAEHAQNPDLPVARLFRERLAAWDKTIVITDEAVPNSAVLTYMHGHVEFVHFNFLAKIMPGIKIDGKFVSVTNATEVQVEDFPGGVEAKFKLGNINVKTEIMPLMKGRGTEKRQGAVLYKIETQPVVPVNVQVGGGKKIALVYGKDKYVRGADILPFEQVSIEEGIVSTQSIGESVSFAETVSVEDELASVQSIGANITPLKIRTSGDIDAVQDKKGNESLSINMETGSGYVLLTYSEDPKIAAELIKENPENVKEKITSYYKKLLSASIKTPEHVIDKAFNSALYNLEYNWIEPYGWVECCHHWLALWHMQVTAGAEWIGQSDRSKMCTLSYARNLFPNGGVAQLSPNGHTHKCFGGSNQYLAWQMRHLWRFIADREFAKEAAPALDKIIRQTFLEHDPDNNLLIGWGLQIGNQEDFVATPYEGTTPSIEGINMMNTRAELAIGLGENELAKKWQAKADTAKYLLREKFWMPDLGRFAYFADPEDNFRLDGQYHTFIYPLIWGIVDSFDGYTTLRHLRDRLTDADGEVYLANNFPNHIVSTWGMQAGAAQQPWAAWGLSAA